MTGKLYNNSQDAVNAAYEYQELTYFEFIGVVIEPDGRNISY